MNDIFEDILRWLVAIGIIAALAVLAYGGMYLFFTFYLPWGFEHFGTFK